MDDSNVNVRKKLIEFGQWLDQYNLCPATSGNLSARLTSSQFLVTVSGRHKGHLNEADFVPIQLDLDTPLAHQTELIVLEDQKPSAETWIHSVLYRLNPNLRYILHTHSAYSTVLSRSTKKEYIEFEGYEMQKALTGITTHECTVSIPIFQNTQDMCILAQQIETRWHVNPFAWGLLVQGHGLYAWGSSESEVRRHVEGLEFLMQCHILETSMLRST
jgi:methylthioribulose-1-phosphate dehydratase